MRSKLPLARPSLASCPQAQAEPPALQLPAFGGQLSAGGADLPAPRVAHGAGHPLRPDPPNELPLRRLGAGVPSATRGRVERDQIHMNQGPERTMQPLAQQVSAPRLVIDLAD